MNFLVILQAGGIMMIPLSALAITALAVGFDKFFTIRQKFHLPKNILSAINSEKFSAEKFNKALNELDKQSFYYQFFEIFTSKNHFSAQQFEAKCDEAAKKIEQKLNSNLWILETIITSAPLMGLLGTIFGMMSSFKIIGQGGVVNPTGVSVGVAESLVATGFGLVVAIIALFLFNIFEELKNRKIDEIEILANHLTSQHQGL